MLCDDLEEWDEGVDGVSQGSGYIHIYTPHSSILAWKIPWMEEPGRLQFMGSLGVGHD